jgi:hypothetical protein
VARDDLIRQAAGDEVEAHRLIEDYLAELRAAGRMAADDGDEVADGVWETLESHRRRGLSPAEAARAALAEFGSVETVAPAFWLETRRVDTHRLGRRLLATGPLVGVLWLTAMLLSAAPPLHGQLPGPWMLVLIVAAAAVVGAPSAAVAVAASRPWRRLPLPSALARPAATVASGAAVAGDVTILAVVAAHVLLLNGHLSWPAVLVAAAASLVRAVLAGRVVARAIISPSR